MSEHNLVQTSHTHSVKKRCYSHTQSATVGSSASSTPSTGGGSRPSGCPRLKMGWAKDAGVPDPADECRRPPPWYRWQLSSQASAPVCCKTHMHKQLWARWTEIQMAGAHRHMQTVRRFLLKRMAGESARATWMPDHFLLWSITGHPHPIKHHGPPPSDQASASQPIQRSWPPHNSTHGSSERISM